MLIGAALTLAAVVIPTIVVHRGPAPRATVFSGDADGPSNVLAGLEAFTTTTTTTTRPPPPPARAGLRPVNWDGIARCETGGNWAHVGYARDGSRYDGGLGILHENWLHWGGTEFAPSGDLATRDAQIVVAERMYHTFGNLRGWGCWRYG